MGPPLLRLSIAATGTVPEISTSFLASFFFSTFGLAARGVDSHLPSGHATSVRVRCSPSSLTYLCEQEWNPPPAGVSCSELSTRHTTSSLLFSLFAPAALPASFLPVLGDSHPELNFVFVGRSLCDLVEQLSGYPIYRIARDSTYLYPLSGTAALQVHHYSFLFSAACRDHKRARHFTQQVLYILFLDTVRIFLICNSALTTSLHHHLPAAAPMTWGCSMTSAWTWLCSTLVRKSQSTMQE